MDRRTITLIWLGGLVLMVVVYLIGPQDFLAACERYVTDVSLWLSNFLDTLMLRGFEVVRAAAIALYVVFVVLAVLAMQRRQRAGSMLVVVSIVFLLLVRTDWYAPGTKWFLSAVLAGVGAMVLTKRLIHAPRPRDPADPWGVAARSSPPQTPTQPPS